MVEHVLSMLNLNDSEKIITIEEKNFGDAHFVLASIISKCFTNKENICLVLFHSTVDHFQNVGKRLKYNLLNQIETGNARLIEPLNCILDDLSNEGTSKYLSTDKNEIVKQLYLEIKTNLTELSKNGRPTTLIIDDVSHLLDLNVDLKSASTFLKYCCNLTIGDVRCIINCHTSCENDRIIANMLAHCSDVKCTVSDLETGPSVNVSGTLNVNRLYSPNPKENSIQYRYKLKESGIIMFKPGTNVMYSSRIGRLAI